VPLRDFDGGEWKKYAFNGMTSFVNGVEGIGPQVNVSTGDLGLCAFP